MLMKFLIESENGHEEQEVKKQEAEEKIKQELKNGKWITLEKKDGKSELLTDKDLDTIEWTNTLENVKSITATKKIKGG